VFFLKKGEIAMHLVNHLRASATRSPQKTAIIFDHERISYEEFEHATTSLACWLIRQGCRPGDRIALLGPNSIELARLLFACFKAGLIAVPINVRLKAPEISYILEHSKPAICFSHPRLAGVANEACANLAVGPRLQIGLGNLGSENPDIALPTVDEDQVALILYTSGTTAKPKGVMHTQRSLFECTRNARTVPDSLQVILSSSQMASITAFSFGLLPAVISGTTVVLVSAFDAPVVLDMIERHQCTFAFGLPSMVQLLIEEQERKARNVGSLRTFVVSGDSFPGILHERFHDLFGLPLRESYGMTETGGSISNPPDGIRAGSLGKPIEGVTVHLVDAMGGEVSDGQIGEIVVHTPAHFIGYWNDSVATGEALRNGWVQTGDLGRRDADGYFWFEGRKKEIIVRDGMNISPQEVEDVIYKHPAVLDAAVTGLPDPVPARGEKVVAFVRLRGGLVADEEDLKAHARQRLADFKVPETIVFVDGLPQGITGKIQRRALKEMARSDPS
jgi:long-chain acyl-CoA synthetase